MNSTVEKIVATLDLLPHPEGGFYKETYRSHIEESFEGFDGKRNVATGIYYLLEKGDFSAFHRIKSDETWHFYKGEALELFEIDLHGQVIQTMIGNDLEKGEKPQYTVKAGHWFASRSTGKYSLVGCTVYPGFDFADFEMAQRNSLLSDHPEHKELIIELTRD